MPVSIPGKDELLNELDECAQAMITDRSQHDVEELLNVLQKAWHTMTGQERVIISNPHKGAYNVSDRERVSIFCNCLVEIMDEFYGVTTTGYNYLPDDWESIPDPTQADLEEYIHNIKIVRDFWCNEMNIQNDFQIDEIYNGISLETANNIERALKAIHYAINKYIFSMDLRYCGQQYGQDVTDVFPCGYALQNDTSQYGIWTGAN